ncbi:hypothetical protein K501DRAFT_268211 [Backusella circina FSU 941]|nr:hypothetical protein K501DRAFT_268211 [Backusella circina FSU 941]
MKSQFLDKVKPLPVVIDIFVHPEIFFYSIVVLVSNIRRVNKDYFIGEYGNSGPGGPFKKITKGFLLTRLIEHQRNTSKFNKCFSLSSKVSPSLNGYKEAYILIFQSSILEWYFDYFKI